jgi:SpoIIAA-like
MIKELSDMPAGVIGFEVTGKIQAEDYRDVILPALERAAQTGQVRFLLVMPEFQGMSGGALWQDLKVGVQHLPALFGWMTPGETKVFPLAERDQAISWVAG